MTTQLDRRSFDAIIAASSPSHAALTALAPLAPLGVLTSAARQGLLDRRLVTSAAVPLRHTRLIPPSSSSPIHSTIDLSELIDIVWLCVTAGQGAALLDVAVPALDSAWLLAGPLGTLADGREPTQVIAGRLDPTSSVSSMLFEDLPVLLDDLRNNSTASLHKARADLTFTWGDLVGVTVDLARFEVYCAMPSSEIKEAVVLTDQLGDSIERWELMASLANQWPRGFKELITTVLALAAQS
jgi:hypothetical protein